jgi:drug/metabolite transporter (DMT)-like permease
MTAVVVAVESIGLADSARIAPVNNGAQSHLGVLRPHSENHCMSLSRNAATLLGATAILQWGAQVLISTYALAFPPFETIALTFFIAFLAMLAKWIWKGETPFRYARHGASAWAIGVGGLFGYYLVYYLALQRAPALDVSLLVNLWPLLMVLFTGLLPGHRLRWHHVVGCLVGAAGSIVLLGPEATSLFDGAHFEGQLLAIAAAFIWAAFCVSSRTLEAVPTDIVGWYCLVIAALGLACHLLFENTVVTAAPSAWDIGVKRGNIRLLGIVALFIPMISTGLLIAAGRGVLDGRVALASLLVTGGTIVAAKEEIVAAIRSRKRRGAREETAPVA